MERRDTYLAIHMAAAHKKFGQDAQIRVDHDPICESPSVTFTFNSKRFDFMFGRTPFNSHEAERLIGDKSLFYAQTKNALPWPHTESFPKRSDLSDTEIAACITGLVDDPNHPISFPVILKPNQGSLSRNVFLCDTQERLIKAISAIRHDYNHGDEILVQQCLGDENGLFTEMRAFCFMGKTEFVFDRQTDEEIPHELLTNPTQWPGLRLSPIDDPDIISQIDHIAAYMKRHHGADYFALDLMCDRAGKIWLMEGNVAPMSFAKIEEKIDNGRDIIDNLTRKMFEEMRNRSGVPTQSSQNEYDDISL